MVPFRAAPVGCRARPPRALCGPAAGPISPWHLAGHAEFLTCSDDEQGEPMPARPSRARAPRWVPVLAVFAFIGLSGCSGPERDTFAPACPSVAPLPTAGEVTIYKPGGGRDLTDVQLQGRISSAAGSCEAGDAKNTIDAVVRVSMQFQRGPAAPTRQANVPYFVAVSKGNTILDKTVRAVQVNFPANIDTASATTEPVQMTLPVSAGSSAAAYTVWVGFQLAPPERPLAAGP
jgi:hypothetical protein